VTISGPVNDRVDFHPPGGYTEIMFRSPKRNLSAAGLLLVLLVGGYTAYWYSIAAQVRSGIQDWSAGRAAEGWTVELGSPDVSGFPFSIDIRLQTPRLTGPERKWVWALPNIRASSRPWQLQQINISASGLYDIETRGQRTEIQLARADGELTLRSGRFASAFARLEGVGIRRDGLPPLQADRLTGRLALPPSPAGDRGNSGISIVIDARDITLPKVWRPALGTRVSRFSLDTKVLGEIVPGTTLPDTLTKWRDGGGTLEISAFVLDWQTLSLMGDGTLALDQNLQLQGAMTAEISGIEKTADALIGAGVINARTAFAAKIANRAFSRGKGAVRLPLSIQDRRLYLGPVPLLRLAPIDWVGIVKT